MSMKVITLIFLVLIAGCQSKSTFDVYPVGERIVVAAGYQTPGKKKGDEYVFSVILPKDEWVYSVNSETALYGYLKPHGRHSRKELMIEWIWINRESVDTQQTINGEDSYYLPWYSGIKGDGARIPYRPTENQLRYGDWHRGGYS